MSSYAMTLGDVIERLERLSPDLRCSPAFGEPGSWRGDYCCIAFAPRKEATVREMLSCAKAADGATFTGYKGGDFRMSRKTECYVADYGEYNGEEEDALSVDNFPWLADGKEAEVTRLRAALAAAEAAAEQEKRLAYAAHTKLAAAEAKLAEYERNCSIRRGHEVEDVLAHGDKVLCTTELVAQLFKDRIEAETKLADERKHADELAASVRSTVRDCCGHAGCGATTPCHAARALAAHAARRAARDGQEGTR